MARAADILPACRSYYSILSNIRLPLAIAILIRQCDMINTESIGLAIQDTKIMN